MGREMDLTYENVVYAVQSSASDLASIAAHPVWGDPNGNEFAVEITGERYSEWTQTNGIHHGGMPCQPKWQVRSDANAQASPSFGSFADPTDRLSGFTENVQLSDTRYVVKFYDDNPLTTGVEIGDESLASSAAVATRYLRIFETDGTPAQITQADALISLGGTQLVLNIVAGVASFDLSIDRAKTIILSSDHKYRVDTIDGKSFISWSVFSRTVDG